MNTPTEEIGRALDRPADSSTAQSQDAQSRKGQDGWGAGRGPLLSFWVLALFFVFTSFAFGCLEGWSITVAECILLGGAAIVTLLAPGFWRGPRSLRWPALLIALLVAVTCLQLVPLPAAWWRRANAERVAVFDEGRKAEELLRSADYRSNPLHSQAAIPKDDSPLLTPPTPARIPASFTPRATFQALLALLAAGCLVLFLESVSRDKTLLRRLGLLAGLLGLAVAAIALYQFARPKTLILGIRESAYASGAFGPFVNGNHGESFINLTFPFLYFLMWRASLRESHATNRWGIRIFLAGLFGLHAVLLTFSHSRAALVSLAFYPLAILLSWMPGRQAWAALAAALYLGALAAALWAGYKIGVVQDHGRLRLCSNVPAQNWFLGNGLGSFPERYPGVVTDLPLSGGMTYTHLENEYLQLFFEAGLLPSLLAVSAGFIAIATAFGSIRKITGAVFLAPALASETLHAGVDFIGHVFPLVAAYLLVWLFLVRFKGDRHSRREAGGVASPSDRSWDDDARENGADANHRRGSTPWFRTGILATALVAASITTAIAHSSPLSDGPPHPDFVQGAYIPLVSAERLLASGKPTEALEEFRVAALRGNYYGGPRGAVFNRVRNRNALAGQKLWKQSPSQGWPFLARYALLSESFVRDSRAVEEWALSQSAVPPAFEYPIIVSARRTFWGKPPQTIPFWLIGKLSRSLDARLWPQELEKSSLKGAARLPGPYGNLYPLSLWHAGPLPETRLRLRTSREDGFKWLVSVYDKVDLSNSLRPEGADPRGYDLGTRYYGVNFILVSGDRTPPEFSVVLVHEYQAFASE